MKANDLLDLIGEIDDSIIEGVSNKSKLGKPKWVKITTLAACLCLSITGAFSIIKNYSDNKPTIKNYNSTELSKKLPIIHNEAQFVVNVNDPKEVVGWGDYVFVAKVEDELRTEYSNVRTNEKGKSSARPYTFYKIKVIENLKGNLKLNESIEIFKHGGVSYDGKSISLFEGDNLLEVGKYYILIAASDEDGRLGQGLPNSSIELNINNDDELSNSDVYKAYKDYVQNEITFDRKRFRSIYDNS